MKKQKHYQGERRSGQAMGKEKWGRYAGGVGAGILGIVGIAMACPVNFRAVDALDNTNRTVSARIAMDMTASLAVSLDDAEVLIAPKAAGEFAMSQTKLNISTNNPEGYAVYLKTADGKNTLNSAQENIKPGRVDSIATEMAGKDFAGNTWGFALTTDEMSAETTFRPVSGTGEVPVENVATMPNGGKEIYNLGFGAHTDLSLPAGRYANEVMVSVIANPATITNLMNVVYMQDMTAAICENTGEITPGKEVTKRLVDVRDGKRYWVAKLADGNCWMTQNLDYDLKTGEVLNSSTTDVASEWTVTEETERGIPAKSDQDFKWTKSWDLGEIVAKVPSGRTTCVSELPKDLEDQGYTKPDGIVSAWYGQTLTGQCPEDYMETAGMNDEFESTLESALSADGASYDAHYLIGNYYSWGAATAGSGTATDATNTEAGFTDASALQDAASSICPKGWKLPTAGDQIQTVGGVTTSWPFAREDSFYNLLRAYGYPDTGSNTNATNGWVNGGSNESKTDLAGGSRVRVDYKPVYITRSGSIRPGAGALTGAASNGFTWSSTAYAGSDRYSDYFNVNLWAVLPSSHYSRAFGYPMRCVVR